MSNRLLIEGGVGQYRSRCRREPDAGCQYREPDSHCRAVCGSGGMPAERRHARPDLSISRTGGSNVNQNVNWNAAGTYVSGGQNLKIGYQGALLYDRSERVHQQRVPAVRDKQCDPGPVDNDDQPVRDEATRSLRSYLRAGSVDDRSLHASGRPALRPRVELFPRSKRLGRSGSFQQRSSIQRRRASRGITT